MYVMLNDGNLEQLRRERLLALEADHYRLYLTSVEARLLGEPAGEAGLEEQLARIGKLIEHYQTQLADVSVPESGVEPLATESAGEPV